MRRIFSLVLTDNGSEFSDEDARAELFGEQKGEIVLFYCEARRADQKGSCEKNHEEIRKLLPKGKGIRFDKLTRKDCSVVMSNVNSEPRGSLGFKTPIEMFVSVFGKDAHTLLDAFGIEKLGIEDINLTTRCLNTARAKQGCEVLF